MKKCFKLAISILLGPILLGCGTIDETFVKTHNQVPDEKTRESYVLAHPELKQEIRNTIKGGAANIGMSKEELVASWGNPDLIKVKPNSGADEMWFYWNAWNFHRHVYFKDGIVTKIE